MNFYVAVGLDAVTLLIVGYCIYAATKKGFLRTVVQMVAYVLVLVVASTVSRAAAPILYDRVVEPMLFERGDNAANRGERLSNADLVSRIYDPTADPALAGSVTGGYAPAQAQSGRMQALALAPYARWISAQPVHATSLRVQPEKDLLSSIVDFLDENELKKLLEENGLEEMTDDLLSEIAENTVRPMAINALSMIGFVLLFGLLSILMNLLLSTLGIIRYVPVIGGLNAFLGAVVGAIQGLLLMWLAALLLNSLLDLNHGQWWIFSESILDKTFLFRYFSDPGLLRDLLSRWV